MAKFKARVERNRRNNLNKHVKARHSGTGNPKKSPGIVPGSPESPKSAAAGGKIKCPKCPYSAEPSLVGRHLEGAHAGVACGECEVVAESREGGGGRKLGSV